MMPYRLPPAGNHIRWSDWVDESALRGLFTPWEGAYFGSGTSALAALLTVLRKRFPQRDDVILAAYNCPNIISAARYAGCSPRLVDLAPGKPWMDLEAVKRVLSPRTLAIICVDLFGIPERYAALTKLARDNGCACIQDSAQAFPKRAGDKDWQGDAVILSFGRGKPVTLLAGGAVLSRDRALVRDCAEVAEESHEESEANHRLYVTAYNLLRHPRLYWWPASLSALRLGETRFEPLERITAMPGWLKRRVPTAVARYRNRGTGMELHYAVITAPGGIVDLARSCGLERDSRLSRYPLLAQDRQTRDQLCERLKAYGASRFYGSVLTEVPGLEDLAAVPERFTHAREFAHRLMTLPTHDGVIPLNVAAVGRLLGNSRPPVIKPVGESAG